MLCSTDTETQTVFTTVYVPSPVAKKRYAASEALTAVATPFASRVASIPDSLVLAGCSCIQTRIPITTTTTTAEQQLTLAGPTSTTLETVLELVTVQTQSTTTETTSTTTTYTSLAHATAQVCMPAGGYCDFDSIATCCNQTCANGQFYNCGGYAWCCYDESISHI
jgi:hypothetical protein